jgi:hypothetical protein
MHCKTVRYATQTRDMYVVGCTCSLWNCSYLRPAPLGRVVPDSWRAVGQMEVSGASLPRRPSILTQGNRETRIAL